jgi:hypothetical protein
MGAIVVVLATAMLGALSRVPWNAGGSDDQALVRLSWRARSESVLACRPLSVEEREGLPAHMRQDSVCERRASPFRLAVRLDGEEVADDTLRGAGARGDRPLYVLREVPVAAGRHRIQVEFGRLAESATPLRLDEQVQPAKGEIVLVTLGENRLLIVDDR